MTSRALKHAAVLFGYTLAALSLAASCLVILTAAAVMLGGG